MTFRAMVFDFDGVILESVAIKGRAFRRLFAEHPEHLDRLERFHYDNGGLSRHIKIEWFFREAIGRPVTRDEIEVLAERFGALIAEEIQVCPFVPGAAEFLERQAALLPLFVASGTPEIELRAVVAARGLAPRFAGVFGAPANKTTILLDIMARTGAAPDEMLFVGDGRQDAEAADAAGVPFIGRMTPGQPDPFGDVPLARIVDLVDLDRQLPDIARLARACRSTS